MGKLNVHVAKRVLSLRYYGNIRDRMYFHPLRMESVLDQSSNNLNVRAHRWQRDLIGVVGTCCLGVLLGDVKSANNLKD